jgi:hypothetical protein
LFVGLLAGCSQPPPSPQIVCALDGKLVATAFTFAEFKQTLADEHRQVEATGYAQLMTPALVVYFKPSEHGSLLAERVLMRQSGKDLSPAVFFGLTKDVSEVVRAAACVDHGTNGPVFFPAAK